MLNSNLKPNLVFFDTTLRDGEQSPGVSFNVDEKLKIARQLSRLGIDVLEAGFPVSSDSDFLAIQAIAKEIGPILDGRKNNQHMVISGLARAVISDIKRCFDAIESAPRHRINIFLATSDIHLKYKLKISREQCIKCAIEAVTYARTLCNDVEFLAEDSGRSDKDFLCKVLGQVIKAGATTLTLPDTVGYNTPEQYSSIVSYAIKNTPGSEKVIWSTHCHNDLGLATANTLAGISAGARQVEVTINGIGERAGNASFEEVCMSIYTHPNSFPVSMSHINTAQILPTSKMVSALSGMSLQSNKAIVGANAFTHESGIHQDGILKHEETYQVISPEIVGVSSSSLKLGKLSGRSALRSHLKKLRIPGLDDRQFQLFFDRFKQVAETKRFISDQDLIALANEQVIPGELAYYKFESFKITSSCEKETIVNVKLLKLLSEDPVAYQSIEETAKSNNPTKAIFLALQKLIHIKHVLLSYEIRNLEKDGLVARYSVKLSISSELYLRSGNKQSRRNFSNCNGKNIIYHGQGTDQDPNQAGVKAYLSGINQIAKDDKSGLLQVSEKSHL